MSKVIGSYGKYEQAIKYAESFATYYCFRNGVPDGQRDEIINDARLAALEAQKTCPEGHPLRAWVTMVASRRVVDGLRKRNWFSEKNYRGPLLVDPCPDTTEEISVTLDQSYHEAGYDNVETNADFVSALRKALPYLSKADREWVEMMLSGMTQLEISRVLNITDSAVTKRKNKAVETIQKVLAAA